MIGIYLPELIQDLLREHWDNPEEVRASLLDLVTWRPVYIAAYEEWICMTPLTRQLTATSSKEDALRECERLNQITAERIGHPLGPSRS